MITPRKHLDLDASLLRVASVVLRETQKRGIIEIERLRLIVAKRTGPDGELSFFPALGFLFLLGKLDYHLKNDTLEYKAD